MGVVQHSRLGAGSFRDEAAAEIRMRFSSLLALPIHPTLVQIRVDLGIKTSPRLGSEPRIYLLLNVLDLDSLREHIAILETVPSPQPPPIVLSEWFREMSDVPESTSRVMGA